MRSLLLVFFDEESYFLKEEFQKIYDVQTISASFSDVKRRNSQMLADSLIPLIGDQRKRHKSDYALGVTRSDLYSRNLNFVFGLASYYEKSCVISVARLMTSNTALYKERVTKEAMHEMGHLLGLGHCHNPKCVMYFSNCLADTDYKSKELCQGCKEFLE